MGREHADLIAQAWALAQRGERMEAAVEMMHARRHRWDPRRQCRACVDDLELVAAILLAE